MVSAICAKIGRTMFAVAVLLTISVIQVVSIQQMTKMAKGGNAWIADSCCPSHFDSPETFEASDKAKPLPKIHE